MKDKISKSKLKKIAAFDPSGIGLLESNIFGLPFNTEEAEVVVVPVPWEVTVSYRGGTAKGPQAIFDASKQVDLYDQNIKDAWKLGISMEPISKNLVRKNAVLRKKAEACIAHLERGGNSNDPKLKKLYREVNEGCEEMNDYVESTCTKFLEMGKSVVVLGGEHSVPLGYMKALSKIYDKFSVLHIDAHADLRETYEGFEFSHASIQFNATKIKNIDRFVLLGIRDYCQEEADRIANSKGRIVNFTDAYLKRGSYDGVTWKKQCKNIVSKLSKNVYVSYDIDSLNPYLCPHTGTPVPGGLEFEQGFYLIEEIIKSGRKIIGFDLCEVSFSTRDEWDAIIGARILYRLSNLMSKSQGKFS